MNRNMMDLQEKLVKVLLSIFAKKLDALKKQMN